jgi:hypothetical protein
MAIPIIEFKKLHCKEGIISWTLLQRKHNLHMPPIPEGWKFVWCSLGQRIAKALHDCFPHAGVIHVPAGITIRIIDPRVKDINP